MATEKPTAAFVLSLLAGIFIMLGGGVISMMGLFVGPYQEYGGMMGGYYGYGGYGGFGWMMNGYGPYGMMRGLRVGFGFIGVLGLIFGVIVIVSALMLNSRSNEHTTWGCSDHPFLSIECVRRHDGRFRCWRYPWHHRRCTRDYLETSRRIYSSLLMLGQEYLSGTICKRHHM